MEGSQSYMVIIRAQRAQNLLKGCELATNLPDVGLMMTIVRYTL